MRLFVYGTLRKGGSFNFLMESTNSTFISPAETLEEFTMYSVIGHYPCIVKGGDTKVVGEIYEVDDLGVFDEYEGYPLLFDREKITTSSGEAWVYLFNKDVTRFKKINSGDWFDAI